MAPVRFLLGGALVQILRDRLPLHWVGALAAAIVSGGLISVLHGWGAQLSAPLLTYVILWVASVVPSPRLIKKNDISYGVYIFAFPVQQLLAIAAFYKHGLVAFDLAALAMTVLLAAASWILVERPVMRRARRQKPRAADAAMPATSDAPAQSADAPMPRQSLNA